MPHIVLEYDPDLEAQHDLGALCRDLFDTALGTGTFPDPAAIKVRATPCRHFYLADGVGSFAHATVYLMEGRDQATQAHVTAAMLACLAKNLPQVGSLTVDIRDICQATYSKRILAPEEGTG